MNVEYEDGYWETANDGVWIVAVPGPGPGPMRTFGWYTPAYLVLRTLRQQQE